AALEQVIILGPAVHVQDHHPLLAILDRLAGRLVGIDRQQHRTSRQRADLSPEWCKHFLHHTQHGLGLERGTVQSLYNLGKKPGFEGLVRQPLNGFPFPLTNSHALSFLIQIHRKITGRTYVRKEGAAKVPLFIYETDEQTWPAHSPICCTTWCAAPNTASRL